MGDDRLKINHPLLNKYTPWCNYIPRIKIPYLAQRPDSVIIPDIKLKLNPYYNRLLSPIARPPAQTNRQRIWKFIIQFSKLIKAMDIDIKGIAMNGRRKGCHLRESQPIGTPLTKGCNTHYKSGTEAHAHLEIRPVKGTNISRAYRFYVDYNKPLVHNYKGILPITTYGVYGKIGPVWHAKGPLCQKVNLGPFDDAVQRCAAYERYFNIPLNGSIPRYWTAKFGHLTYVLDYPFRLKRTFTKGFLGTWGMVDRSVYRRLGVPYMTFPTRIDHILELVSTIDVKRATHINLNKPYNRTKGPWPHIEWLDLHDVRINILLRDGKIDVPGMGQIVFNRAEYLKEENLDRHPQLLAIAAEWRKYRKGAAKENLLKAKQLAREYYKQRAIIIKTTNRILVRATAKNITITIDNPSINSLDIPLGGMRIKADGLSIGKIVITVPSVADIRFGRRKISEVAVSLEGVTAKKISLNNSTTGISVNAEDVRLGRVMLDHDGKLVIKHLDAYAWRISSLLNGFGIKSGYTYIGSASVRLKGNNKGVKIDSLFNRAIEIGSKLFALKLKNTNIVNLSADFYQSSRSLSIKKISTDIDAGRIGSVSFGKVHIGRGSIGRGNLRKGYVSISNLGGVLRANIGGLIDIVINQTAGQQLDLNVPGLGVSGKLSNIRLKGPANFMLTPKSWDISRIQFKGNSQNLSASALLTSGEITHDPGVQDAKLKKSPYRKIFATNLKLTKAKVSVGNIDRISFQNRFHFLGINDVSIDNIVGSGKGWIKIPPWEYMGARFKRLLGTIKISSVLVKSNGAGKNSKFKDVEIDFKETQAGNHRCYLKLPLLMFSPNQYFIGDPQGKPLKLKCQFNAWLRGGYFQFRNKRRPVEKRRPYKP